VWSGNFENREILRYSNLTVLRTWLQSISGGVAQVL
jgi:hypothetical protein